MTDCECLAACARNLESLDSPSRNWVLRRLFDRYGPVLPVSPASVFGPDLTEEQVLRWSDRALAGAPVPGKTYRNPWGHTYRVLAVSLVTHNLDPLVTFRGIQEPTVSLTITLEDWLSSERGLCGKIVPRFTLCEE